MLFIQIIYTLFVGLLIPIYWRAYGISNFLWFSDIALFLMVGALWFESSLLNSMIALWFLPFTLLWNIDFFIRLFTKHHALQITEYMFDKDIPLLTRAISLFHIFMPILIIWLLFRLGYNHDAFFGSCILTWILLPITYWSTSPKKNINWVYGFGKKSQTWIHPVWYLIGLIVLIPIIIFIPMHLVLSDFFNLT